nr:alpha/beta fold hydrolase [Corynebacterium lactis]
MPRCFRLAGQWVLPLADDHTSDAHVSTAVVLHPATGVDLNLYRKFAAYLAEQGWAVLVYDLRGTGASISEGAGEKGATGDRGNRSIRMSDWILKDVPAATAALKARFPHARHFAIGHSVGAHGMIATQAQEPVDAMVMVASHAGITRLISTAAERAKIWAVFNVVTPLASRLLGYVPIEALGMGKPVPVGVMTQWAGWTRQRGYFFDDPEFDLADRYAAATGPLLSLVFTDDLWANRRAVDVLTDRAVRCDVVKRDIEAGRGTKRGPVGHMGFYRSKNRALWPEVVSWLDACQGRGA